MIGLEVHFLAGRFHANSWHHAHNEGVAEWPPSPWRVLRALVASAFEQGIPASQVEPLLEKLRQPPSYRLPAAREAHTRHYMPDVSDAAHKKAKVFDTFVAVDGGAADPRPLTIVWQASLTDEEGQLLRALAARVPYLGRAESWARIEVSQPQDGPFDCWPADDGDAGPSTVLMTIESAEALNAWAAGQAKPKKNGAPDVPRTLWDVLTFSGERFRAEGWSRVPGTKLSRYVFSGPPFQRPSSRADRSERARRRPIVARFDLRSPVLPRVTESLAVGERLRVALMSRSALVSGDATPVFSGHADAALNHRHAHYLSHADERGRIDHVVVSAPMGFDIDDQRALQSLRRVWGRSGHDIDLVLTGMWEDSELRALDDEASPLIATSATWRSLTPFVPTRHPKLRRGVERGGIEAQVRAACRQSLGVEPIRVTAEDAAPQGTAGWWQFMRRRKAGGGRRGPDVAYGVRLTFEQPVRGPVALGYGAHFGLGTFLPVQPGDM